MSGEMASVRRYYGVPAYRGRGIVFTYQGRRSGVILSARDHKLWVRFDGEATRFGPLHPTWEMEYVDA